MKIQQIDAHMFVITRGNQEFAFFVDSDRTAWSSRGVRAIYSTRELAQSGMDEILRRNRMRRKSKLEEVGDAKP